MDSASVESNILLFEQWLHMYHLSSRSFQMFLKNLGIEDDLSIHKSMVSIPSSITSTKIWPWPESK